MKFCQHCAGPITHRIPPGDDKLRYCCLSCDVVFYQNPNNVVGTLPWFEDKVLLCRRAIEPRLGKWTLPAGFMENGESTLQGAIRETVEEAGATVLPERASLYTLFNLPHINQVYLLFRAPLENLVFTPGEESLEVGLFREEEIPWDDIAFHVIRITLEHYFADRRSGLFPVRMFDLHYSADRSLHTSLISHSHASPQ